MGSIVTLIDLHLDITNLILSPTLDGSYVPRSPNLFYPSV